MPRPALPRGRQARSRATRTGGRGRHRRGRRRSAVRRDARGRGDGRRRLLRAIEAILRGDVEHAFHPGGGLHHAMPDRASGFCIYNDPALAIARSRGTPVFACCTSTSTSITATASQAIHWDDPRVLTCLDPRNGGWPLPGHAVRRGDSAEGAPRDSVNVPLEPGTRGGELAGRRRALVPELAAAFGPDLIVSQHGADSHAWDPLAHLRVTTTAMGAAARLVDTVAHRHAGGRWLATGGGGYDAYRVVPRLWTLVWLAGAHREVPDATPAAWRDRWSAEAPGTGRRRSPSGSSTRRMPGCCSTRRRWPPRRIRARRLRSSADSSCPACSAWRGTAAGGIPLAETDGVRAGPRCSRRTDGRDVDRRVGRRRGPGRRLTLAPGVIAPAAASDAHRLVAAGLRDGLHATIAVTGTTVVGAALSHRPPIGRRESCSRSGSHPPGAGAGSRATLLAAHVGRRIGRRRPTAEVTVAERDPLEPARWRPAPRHRPAPLAAPGSTCRDARRSVPRDPFAISAVRPVASRSRTVSAIRRAASDIVDVRLLEAMKRRRLPGLRRPGALEQATMDAIINERVLDIGFRADLERKQGFCRRHVAELVPTDRRGPAGSSARRCC